MIKTTLFAILGLLLLAIIVIAAIAAMRPDTFRVSRSVSIAAPAEKIFPLINDVHEFNSWNPYNKKDPEMRGSYRGPVAGSGAHYDFDSKKSGSGSFEVLDSNAPTQVRMRLDMTAPFEVHNVITFTLAQQGAMTVATWAMDGPNPFIARCMGVIFSMDKMVGTDFEVGLAALKARVEKG